MAVWGSVISEESGMMRKRNTIAYLFLAVFSALLFCACGGSSGSAASAASQVLETEAEATPSAAVEVKTTAAVKQTEKAKEIRVIKHAQDGRAMVIAGGMTLSVPTTFTGLEKDGFVFSGADETVKSGGSGTCRVYYKNSPNHIMLSVKNLTEDTLRVRDCTIKGVEVKSETPDPDLMLYGVPMGATRQQVADIYGEPFSKDQPDDSKVTYMTYQFGEDIYSEKVVMFFFKNGKAYYATYEDFSLVGK